MPRRWCCIALIAIVAIPAVAQAKGTMRVQQANGSVQVYDNVDLAVTKRTLRITTADKKGILIVDRAACTVSDGLMSCLPDRVQLDQGGLHLLDFNRGTVYINNSDSVRQLSHSTTQLPAGGVLGTLVSYKGTYVTWSGTLDSSDK